MGVTSACTPDPRPHPVALDSTERGVMVVGVRKGRTGVAKGQGGHPPNRSSGSGRAHKNVRRGGGGEWGVQRRLALLHTPLRAFRTCEAAASAQKAWGGTKKMPRGGKRGAMHTKAMFLVLRAGGLRGWRPWLPIASSSFVSLVPNHFRSSWLQHYGRGMEQKERRGLEVLLVSLVLGFGFTSRLPLLLPLPLLPLPCRRLPPPPS